MASPLASSVDSRSHSSHNSLYSMKATAVRIAFGSYATATIQTSSLLSVDAHHSPPSSSRSRSFSVERSSCSLCFDAGKGRRCKTVLDFRLPHPCPHCRKSGY